MLRSLLLATLIASPAFANDDTENFVEANLLGIFYHELGHAVIDLQQVPIFGQEEDAADVFSIFLIDALYEPEAAEQLARDAAFGFLGEAISRDAEGGDVAWWDVHGADEQRFYNTVCLFYGADPEARADFAEFFELPEDRAVYCPDEYQQASDSWGAVLDEIWTDAPTQLITYTGATGPDASLTEQLISQEVEALNQFLSLDQPLSVSVESCGEANAFYDPSLQGIIVCTEFEDHLIEMLDRL